MKQTQQHRDVKSMFLKIEPIKHENFGQIYFQQNGKKSMGQNKKRLKMRS